MKKLLFGLFIIIPAMLGVAAILGIPPSYIAAAPGVGTGIGAKLLCSSKYVSGFSEEQALEDLVQFSPILNYLNVEFDDNNRRVRTSLFGIRSATASYVPGIGCAIDYAGFDQRQAFQARELPVLTSHWPHGTRVETINDDIQSLLDDIVMRDNNNNLDTRALLVVHNGRVVAQSYAGGARADTPLLGWSMAKSMTAIMLGNLELRSLLDVNDTPGFLEWAEDSRVDIRIEDLLTMTDGLAFTERYNPGDDATAMLFTEPAASAYVLRQRQLHAPGSHFNYSSGTANLLSRIFFDRTGGSLQSAWNDYVANVVVPMSLQHTVFEADASGVFKGSSYLYASAQDWARMGQLMLDEGVINGRRIVSRDWVRRSTSPNQSDNGVAYGYQWWLNAGAARLRWPDLPEDAYAAQGNREQILMVVPSANAVLVRLGWSDPGYPVNARFREILDALERLDNE